MPKRKPKTPTIEEVDAALRRLDEHINLGKRLRKEAPTNPAARQKLAKSSSVSTSDSNLQAMRRFAELLYGKLEENLDETLGDEKWQALRGLSLTGSGLPLSWSHCAALASAGTYDKLFQVAKQAARSGWSSDEIRRHLRLDTGGMSKRPGSGRSVQKPKNLQEGLQQLLANLEVVKKRVEALRELDTPAEIGNKLVVLKEAMNSLCDSDAVKRALQSR